MRDIWNDIWVVFRFGRVFGGDPVIFVAGWGYGPDHLGPAVPVWMVLTADKCLFQGLRSGGVHN